MSTEEHVTPLLKALELAEHIGKTEIKIKNLELDIAELQGQLDEVTSPGIYQ